MVVIKAVAKFSVTMEDLKQYLFLRKEILELENELIKTYKQAGKESDSVTGSLAEFPYTKTSYKLIGDDRCTRIKVKQLSEQIKKRYDALVSYRIRIETFMENTRNSEIRLIIHLKYIKGMTWLEISKEVYNSLEESTSRKKLERFFDEY